MHYSWLANIEKRLIKEFEYDWKYHIFSLWIYLIYLLNGQRIRFSFCLWPMWRHEGILQRKSILFAGSSNFLNKPLFWGLPIDYMLNWLLFGECSMLPGDSFCTQAIINTNGPSPCVIDTSFWNCQNIFNHKINIRIIISEEIATSPGARKQ